MKDCKGTLITQNFRNVQLVKAMVFFGRSPMNETALRYKRIPFFLLQHTSFSHTATVEYLHVMRVYVWVHTECTKCAVHAVRQNI
jgi:hypothetical protein